MHATKTIATKKIRALIITMLALVSFSPAHAVYDDNMSGVVTFVLTYADDGRIFLQLDNQPATHPTCNPDFFSIDAAVPDAIRSQLLSRLLVAYANGESVNIGFDSQGNCSHGRIRVHRIG